MGRRFCNMPAFNRRAFFVAIALATALPLSAKTPPTTTSPKLNQIGAADPADAQAALAQMRRLGISGSYFLAFDLRLRPRRGDETVLSGQMWGTRNAEGPITRVALQGDAESRLLIQNGVRSGAWTWRPGRGVESVPVERLFEPIASGTDLTAFDLQMPYLYWDDFSYQGITRFRGRPAHVIVLRPPAEFAKRYPALGGVRLHLDTQFNAAVQTELLSPGGSVTKTITVTDLKKVDDQWIVKTIDVRNETTRDKTRLEITAAALQLDLSPRAFEPSELSEPLRPPAAASLFNVQ